MLILRDDQLLLALFTVCNGSPVLVDAFWPKYKGCTLKSGTVITASYGGILSSFFSIKKLDDKGQLITIIKWGCETDMTTEDSEYYLQFFNNSCQISQNEYNALSSRFSDFSNEKAAAVTAKNKYDYSSFNN
ncbi:MAG: hypothetical protein IJS90_06495 [Clostridia bacterium]|nr:hypothetical protein [Clostridia bacterium]